MLWLHNPTIEFNLCRLFVREVYDGQLFIKLKKGFDFPRMDPWVQFLSNLILTLITFMNHR